MRRFSRTPLRGSVTQSVRMRDRETTRFGFALRLATLIGSIAIITGIGMWLWHIGWPQRQAEHLIDAGLKATREARFAVEDVMVDGRQQVSRDALFAAIGASKGSPILSFDPDAAQARIQKLPWVASSIVERRLPDVIMVHLTERVPLARWQHDGHTIIIDTSGAELKEAKLQDFPNLPLVVGTDAAGQAEALLTTLKDYPAIQNNMMAAVRVGERRWDIHLQPKVVARLPEKRMEESLSRLSSLIINEKILERSIVSVDLRNPSKLVFEPAGSAPTVNPAGDTRL